MNIGAGAMLAMQRTRALVRKDFNLTPTRSRFECSAKHTVCTCTGLSHPQNNEPACDLAPSDIATKRPRSTKTIPGACSPRTHMYSSSSSRTHQNHPQNTHCSQRDALGRATTDRSRDTMAYLQASRDKSPPSPRADTHDCSGGKKPKQIKRTPNRTRPNVLTSCKTHTYPPPPWATHSTTPSP